MRKYRVDQLPYIMAWGGEQEYTVGPCPDLDNELALYQVERRGVGAPLFKARHIPRHRDAALHRLCQLCGEPLIDDGWIFLRAIIDIDGDRIRSWEPPLHRECAATALRLCPVLEAAGLPPIPMPKGTRVYPVSYNATQAMERYGVDIGTAERVIIDLQYSIDGLEALRLQRAAVAALHS